MHGVIPVHIYISYLYHYFGNSHVLFNIQKEVYKMKGNVSFHRVMNNSSDIKQKMESVNKYSLCGVSALGFPSKNSSVRTLMFSKHASQRVVLTHGEVARIFTGAEDAYGVLSSYFITAKSDLVLERKFVKYPNTPYSSILYIFRNVKTGKYMCHLAEAVHWNTEKYGFQNIDLLDKPYHEGSVIPEGTVMSKTTSYNDTNKYCAGANLRVMYTPLHDLTEDAIILSESACKKLEYSMVDRVVVDISEKMFMLNNYGTIDKYKSFPDIGESIQDGVLCSLREISAFSSLSEAMVPHINDVNYYTDGIITDIDVYSNCNEIQDKQLNYYQQCLTSWYQDIYAYISTIISDIDQDDTKLLDIYHKAEKYLTNAKWATKEKLPYIYVVFKILQPKTIERGQKITGRHGNKSVVSMIIPDELMPKDQYGNHVEMLANGFCPTNRIIPFALYEPTITFQMECIHNHIVNNNLPKEEAFELVIEYMKLFNHQYAARIEKKCKLNPDKAYADIVKNGLYMMQPPFQEENVRDAIIAAYERWDIFPYFEWKTKLRHRWITQRKRYAIGYQYTWVLKQEASKNMSAVATGRTTLYDLPVKTSNYKNRKMKYSDNAIKFGEYDTYGFLQVVDVETFAKLTTYYRGSQYEDNSLLMSHLNDMGIPEGAINQFPQLDCLKAYLKAIGIKLEDDFTVNSINSIDQEEDFMIGNHEIKISGGFLRAVLVIYSYYSQYKNYLKLQNKRHEATVDMTVFVKQMLKTDVFANKSDEYIRIAFTKFFDMMNILDEEKFLK